MDQKLFERFEAGAERRGTCCEKWDSREKVFGRMDVLPLWVADMDFQAPDPVIHALAERAQNGVFGYGIHDPASDEALRGWMYRRHALGVEPEWVRTSPGVVQSLLFALKTLTKPGDRVAIQTPVYGPFYRMAKRASVGIYRNPLKQTEVGWEMDLDHLEDGFRQGVRALMLCSPHNPVGRIWTRRELRELVSLCNRYEVGIVSDEIHMDFEMPGFTHIPILNIEGADNAILLASATKTFNLAALRHSSIIIRDEAVRKRLTQVMDDCGVGDPNLFGQLAQTTAYNQGEPWLDALIEYLNGSYQYVDNFVHDCLPELALTRLEGTYLMWVDMRKLGMDQTQLMRFLVDVAGVGPSSGTDFGPEGEGFVRLNLATPRRNLIQAMESIKTAVRNR